jgi:hypothetical protein
MHITQRRPHVLSSRVLGACICVVPSFEVVQLAHVSILQETLQQSEGPVSAYAFTDLGQREVG